MAEIIPLRSPSEDWLVRGATAEAQGCLPEAAASFERAIAIGGPSTQAWYRLGEVRRSLGQFDAAEEAYHKALDIAQEHLPTWFALADLYGMRGRRRLQCFCLSWVLMLDPVNLRARTAIALAHEAAGDPWRAKRHWLKLLAARSSGPEADMARRRLSDLPA